MEHFYASALEGSLPYVLRFFHEFIQSINTRSILTDRPVNLTPPCLATDMVFRSAIAERKRQLVDFSY